VAAPLRPIPLTCQCQARPREEREERKLGGRCAASDQADREGYCDYSIHREPGDVAVDTVSHKRGSVPGLTFADRSALRLTRQRTGEVGVPVTGRKWWVAREMRFDGGVKRTRVRPARRPAVEPSSEGVSGGGRFESGAGGVAPVSHSGK